MFKEICIIGGGHMGQKMFNFLRGKRLNVCMLDLPKVVTPAHLEIVAYYSKIYIASPNASHAFWMTSLPPYSCVLLEKPVCVSFEEFNRIKDYTVRNDIDWTCNLPWRNAEFQRAEIRKGISWSRNKDWQYEQCASQRRTPIGIDIGVHLFDYMGQVLGRDQCGFDEIRCNTADKFEAVYKGTKILLEFGQDVANECNLFGNPLDSVLPESWILKNYEAWLAGDCRILPSADELEWLQHCLENVEESYCG